MALLSKCDNAESAAEGRVYKARFALSPSVDHLDDGTGPANFEICSWKVNDAMNDLTHAAFIELCRAVVGYSEEREQ